MTGAGDLRDKVTVRRRGLDANGDALGDWGDLVTCAAQVSRLKGGEAVMANRLQGRSTSLVTIREWSTTRTITTDDRLKIVRAHQLQADAELVIRDVVRRGDGFMDLLCEVG